ncbi:MAG: UTP--glucose-1-phosphate uridylyltransferase, partial [Pseudomonadota bacterium]
PLIQYAVDEARAAGIEEFIFITSEGKTALEAYFSKMSGLERQLHAAGKVSALDALRPSNMQAGSVRFIRQETPKGLGHAVSLARDAVGDEPFAVILPDDVIRARTPALKQMVAAHARSGGHMIATETVAEHRLSAYGVVDIVRSVGPLQMLRGLVEKPSPEAAPSRSGVVGRYILKPSIFERLADLPPGSGGEIQLTDAIAADLSDIAVNGFAFEGERFDCGSAAGFLEATTAFAIDRPDLRDGLLRFLETRNMVPFRAA